jgi:hypothetical protein
MLESAESILSSYIDTSKVSRFTFYSVEMERGENTEDLYYLCTTEDGYYVVFETDYILSTLADIAAEATEIFKGYDLAPLHWVVKKDAQESVGKSTIPIDASNLEELRNELFSDRRGSSFSYAVRYAVIEFANTKKHAQHRYDPNTYGHVHSN